MRNTLVPLMALGLAATFSAQAQDDRWYLAPSAVYDFADSDRNTDDGLGFGLALGKALSKHWNLELGVRAHSLDSDAGGHDLDLVDLGVDALYLFNRDSGFTPYLVGGLGALRADSGRDDEDGVSANAGAGLMKSLTDRLSLRADARYRWDSVEDNFGDWLVGVGVSYAFGGRAAAPVVAPAPAPAPVAPAPAPRDSDGDGVADARDRCPATPAGATVDANGCELDGDGDGVVDRLDRCLDSKPGAKVDRNGCDLPRVIALPKVTFANNSAVLDAEARGLLDEALKDIQGNRDIRIEVAGHTDDRGAAGFNQQLSERRARAVMDYFVSRGLPAANLGAKGYGEAEPVADNHTAEGRRANRRVELRIVD